MKFRIGMLFVACAAITAAGCSASKSDSKDSKDSAKTPTTKAEKAAAEDHKVKQKQVDEAKKAFDKNSNDVNACRNLGLSYISLASPASSPDPKQPVKAPEDRDKNLKKAVSTLEQCQKIKANDRDTLNLLSSAYMATGNFKKAETVLESLAKTAKPEEKANAYYTLGLAAANAQDYQKAIASWQQFAKLAPKRDPRVKQVRQSITALQQQMKSQKATAATKG